MRKNHLYDLENKEKRDRKKDLKDRWGNKNAGEKYYNLIMSQSLK